MISPLRFRNLVLEMQFRTHQKATLAQERALLLCCERIKPQYHNICAGAGGAAGVSRPLVPRKGFVLLARSGIRGINQIKSRSHYYNTRRLAGCV